MNGHRLVIVIPTYNTGAELLESTTREALSTGFPVLVAVDGSTDQSDRGLEDRLGNPPSLAVMRKAGNSGKGNILLEAARHVLKNNYTHMLVMDSDGQHPASAVPGMAGISRRQPEALVMGSPQFDEHAPRARVHGRKLTIFWTNLETLWCGLGDTLFGMRVYPISPLLKAFAQTSFARGFDFEPEIAVRMAWLGCRPVRTPVPVRYLSRNEGGVSHFHYLRDNCKLTLLHFRLVPEFLLIRIVPFILRKRKWVNPD